MEAKQPATQFKITAVCTITDPEERQRRPMPVYRLVMNSGQQKSAAIKTESEASARPTD
jgi:hypothetical protein